MQVKYMTSGDSILSIIFFFISSASGAILSSLALLSCVLQSCLKPLFLLVLLFKPTKHLQHLFVCLKSLPVTTSKSEKPQIFLFHFPVCWCKWPGRAKNHNHGPYGRCGGAAELSAFCAVMVRVLKLRGCLMRLH